MTCKHLLNGAPDCVFCHRDQLKHELSLAEEGLANYQQEVESLKHDVERVAKTAGIEATENERLRAAMATTRGFLDKVEYCPECNGYYCCQAAMDAIDTINAEPQSEKQP